MAVQTMVEAIRSTLAAEMERDERVMLLGQDVGANGGVFRASEGLLDRFGEDRVVDMPLAEAVIDPYRRRRLPPRPRSRGRTRCAWR